MKIVNETTQIFDKVRKKYLKLTPEEWVRQNFIKYLNKEKKYPIGLMGVEKLVQYNNLKTRADIVLYNTKGEAELIVECKSPDVKITSPFNCHSCGHEQEMEVPFGADFFWPDR